MKYFSKKPVLDPKMQKFIDEVNAQSGPAIYELEPKEARNVLLQVQEAAIYEYDASIQDIQIPSGQDTKIDIRIVKPTGTKEKLPVVIYVHGGGWVLGDKTTHDRLIKQIANGADAAVVFVNYTNSPEAKYPRAIEEIYETLLYVSENNTSLNLDTTKIAVVGDSVGGNMATVLTMLAKARSGPKIDYQILLYPVTDANFNTDSYNEFAKGFWLTKEAMKWFWDEYLPESMDRENYTVSPLQAPVEKLKGLPSALVITNENDVLRDEGESYARKLMEAGVETTAIRLIGTIHDCLMLNSVSTSPLVKDAINLVNCKLRQVFYP